MFVALLLVQAGPVAEGEALLSGALSGRIEGAAVACIRPRFIRRTRVIDGTAVIYEESGSRWYVQRPEQNADQLREGDVMISRSPLASLCRTDIVDIVDRSTGVRTGQATLGRFVPYQKRR